MTTAWNWVKDRSRWVYLAIWIGLAAYSFATGDTAGGWLNVGLAVVMFFVLGWLSPNRAPKSFEVPPDLQLAADALRPPPEYLASHLAEFPDCSLCKGMGWTADE
jgi:hypothetical protein